MHAETFPDGRAGASADDQDIPAAPAAAYDLERLLGRRTKTAAEGDSAAVRSMR